MIAPTETPFWLVWNELGQSPRYKHETVASAETEASRLAMLHPGITFTVLAPVANVTSRALEIQRFTSDDDAVPF